MYDLIYSQYFNTLYVAYVREHTSKLKDASESSQFINKIDCIQDDGYLFSL